jgi:hypothetical protein
MGALLQRPALRVVKRADGAADNWSYLSDTLPVGDECLDFYHASEHLSEALAAADGEATPKYREHFDTLREVLRDHPQGVDQVIGVRCRLCARYPRREVLHKAVAYCGWASRFDVPVVVPK